MALTQQATASGVHGAGGALWCTLGWGSGAIRTGSRDRLDACTRATTTTPHLHVSGAGSGGAALAQSICLENTITL